MTVRNASIGFPPPHPDPAPVQSSSSCSESETSEPRVPAGVYGLAPQKAHNACVAVGTSGRRGILMILVRMSEARLGRHIIPNLSVANDAFCELGVGLIFVESGSMVNLFAPCTASKRF